MDTTPVITQIILKNYFIETERGLDLADPEHPPSLKAFEAMALKLRGEEVGWQIKVGDLAAKMRHFYPDAYQQVFEMCGLAGFHRSIKTIESWASACRSVPIGQRNGLPISYLQVVAPILDPLDQKELLDYALEQKAKGNYSVEAFRHHVAYLRNVPLTQEIPPWEERDNRLFEIEREAYELEIALQEERNARKKAESEVTNARSALVGLRSRLEAFVKMKPTDLMINIVQVAELLREALDAITRLTPS